LEDSRPPGKDGLILRECQFFFKGKRALAPFTFWKNSVGDREGSKGKGFEGERVGWGIK